MKSIKSCDSTESLESSNSLESFNKYSAHFIKHILLALYCAIISCALAFSAVFPFVYSIVAVLSTDLALKMDDLGLIIRSVLVEHTEKNKKVI